MDVLDEEIIKLWRLFFQRKVKYIMVGGFATNLHGFSRTTADLDIWVKDSVKNRKALRDVLEELGLGDMKAIETTQLIPGFTSLRLKSGFELDIMTSMKGFGQKSFERCYAMSPTAVIFDIPVKFLHINQLIKAKKRPLDVRRMVRCN